MKTAAAIALLVGLATAQWDDQGVPTPIDEYYAIKYVDMKWFTIVTSFIMAVYPFPLIGAYAPALGTLGVALTSVSWALAGLIFAGFLPIGILGIFTSVGDLEGNKRWRGWLIAGNIYGWILTASMEVWYVVLILFVLIFHVFGAGEVAPNVWVPIIGIALELILQIMYSVGYGKSKKLMECWIHETSSYCYY